MAGFARGGEGIRSGGVAVLGKVVVRRVRQQVGDVDVVVVRERRRVRDRDGGGGRQVETVRAQAVGDGGAGQLRKRVPRH